MSNLQEGLNALALLKDIGKLSFAEICKLSEEQKAKYEFLLDALISTNSSESSDKEKGKALEEISKYLLQISGDLFSVTKNLYTATNEIDLLVSLNEKGKALCSANIIDNRFMRFVSECKNYKTKVGVTYVGKFASLLLSTQTKLGLLFSYNGITGKGWNDASGLVKKFYLSKEKLCERYCIVDFNIEDFSRIKQGDNLFQIIDEKLISLQYDTDYTIHLSKHPAE